MKRVTIATGTVPGMVVAAVLAACGTGSAPTQSRVPVSAIPAPTATAPLPLTPAAASPRPLKMGTLEPGTYHTNFFEPRLVLTLPAGWSQFFADEVDQIYMGSQQAELAIALPRELRDPVTTARVEAPEDLLGWLIDHPVLNASEPTPATISGVESNYVEFNATREVRVFAFAGGDYRIGAGPRQRMYVVPLDGPDLAVTIAAASSGTLEAALPAATPIVESLQILP